MAELFKEIFPSILHTKKNVLTEEKDYLPFIINKSLSYHQDCVYFANEMNIRWSLPKKIQYDFLRHAIRAKKRSFQPWHKKQKEEDLECIKLSYGVSTIKAREILSLLSQEQIEQLKAQTHKGGKV